MAFLVVYKGDVKLVPVDQKDGAAERVVGMIPDMLGKVKDVFSKDKSKAEKSEDFSEITQDDIDC